MFPDNIRNVYLYLICICEICHTSVGTLCLWGNFSNHDCEGKKLRHFLILRILNVLYYERQTDQVILPIKDSIQ
jgi:hypothetical protein